MGLSKNQKGILKLAKDRARRFRHMSKARKRVAIARDVISQLQSKRLIPKPSHWVTVHSWLTERPAAGVDLREELIKSSGCTVCAMGAIFVSAVMREPDVKVSDDIMVGKRSEVANHGQIRSKLIKYFTDNQLKLIELAFERGRGWNFVDNDRDQDAVRFGEQFPDERVRMAAIMSNIVDNNGTFNPPKLSG